VLETYVVSKQPCMVSKEPCIISKEPYIVSKEPNIVVATTGVEFYFSVEYYILASISHGIVSPFRHKK